MIEKYIRFTIKQPKKKSIKPGLPLTIIDSVYFLNNSSDNLVKNLGEHDFFYPSQEFNANVLDLLQKKYFLPMTTEIALEDSKTAYLLMINFIIY